MIGVRYREDTGLEGRCDACFDYWPLTPEFWTFLPNRAKFRRCKACLYRERRGKPRPYDAEGQRMKRLANIEHFRDVQRAWYDRNREKIRIRERRRTALYRAIDRGEIKVAPEVRRHVHDVLEARRTRSIEAQRRKRAAKFAEKDDAQHQRERDRKAAWMRADREKKRALRHDSTV